MRELKRRARGELDDCIWQADMPPIEVASDHHSHASDANVRLVLLAMASFTNPTRDQVQGPEREWQCFASTAMLAAMTVLGPQTIQRVLRTLERNGYIDRRRDGLHGGGRPSATSHGPRPSRPSVWCLRPDRWRARELPHPGRFNVLSTPETGVRTDASFDPENRKLASGETRVSGNSRPERGVVSGNSRPETVLQRDAINPVRTLTPTGVKEPAAAAANFFHDEDFLQDETPPEAPPPGPPTQPSLNGMLTPVPGPRCLRCHARQAEPARDGCGNPGWHDPQPNINIPLGAHHLVGLAAGLSGFSLLDVLSDGKLDHIVRMCHLVATMLGSGGGAHG